MIPVPDPASRLVCYQDRSRRAHAAVSVHSCASLSAILLRLLVFTLLTSVLVLHAALAQSADIDIVGIKLGMTPAQVAPIMKDHLSKFFDDGYIVNVGNPQVKFPGATDFTTYYLSQTSHDRRQTGRYPEEQLLAVFGLPPSPNGAFYLGRRIVYPDLVAPPLDTIIRPLIAKYGAPSVMYSTPQSHGAFATSLPKGLRDMFWRVDAARTSPPINEQSAQDCVLTISGLESAFVGGSTRLVHPPQELSQDIVDRLYKRSCGTFLHVRYEMATLNGVDVIKEMKLILLDARTASDSMHATLVLATRENSKQEEERRRDTQQRKGPRF